VSRSAQFKGAQRESGGSMPAAEFVQPSIIGLYPGCPPRFA
jgi:hypothetical protein